MQRLGRNIGGYHGERIDPIRTMHACAEAARARGWIQELLPPDTLGRPAFIRPSRKAGAPRIYISTGIHGDEPAGPLAAFRLLEGDDWPDADLWLLPCLNPGGLRAGTRTNPAGIDINRDYRHLRSEEARGHVEWMDQMPAIDLSLLLHEDWESHGFYAYELNASGRKSIATAMVESVGKFCPIDTSTVIDGREVSERGIIRPTLTPAERIEWPEAIWLSVHKGDLNYTLEAPSDWPLEIRVQALVQAVQSGLRTFLGTEPR